LFSFFFFWFFDVPIAIFFGQNDRFIRANEEILANVKNRILSEILSLLTLLVQIL